MHSRDSDCTLDATDTCTACGVYHGDPCPDCGGRGFHAPALTAETWWHLRDAVRAIDPHCHLATAECIIRPAGGAPAFRALRVSVVYETPNTIAALHTYRVPNPHRPPPAWQSQNGNVVAIGSGRGRAAKAMRAARVLLEAL